jgi:hypothetical protein
VSAGGAGLLTDRVVRALGEGTGGAEASLAPSRLGDDSLAMGATCSFFGESLTNQSWHSSPSLALDSRSSNSCLSLTYASVDALPHQSSTFAAPVGEVAHGALLHHVGCPDTRVVRSPLQNHKLGETENNVLVLVSAAEIDASDQAPSATALMRMDNGQWTRARV